jgi:hypothetical protein
VVSICAFIPFGNFQPARLFRWGEDRPQEFACEYQNFVIWLSHSQDLTRTTQVGGGQGDEGELLPEIRHNLLKPQVSRKKLNLVFVAADLVFVAPGLVFVAVRLGFCCAGLGFHRGGHKDHNVSV